MGIVCCSFKGQESSSINNKSSKDYFENFKVTYRSNSESELKAHFSRKLYMKNRMDTVTEMGIESSCTVTDMTRKDSIFSKYGQNTSMAQSQQIDIKEDSKHLN